MRSEELSSVCILLVWSIGLPEDLSDTVLGTLTR